MIIAPSALFLISHEILLIVFVYTANKQHRPENANDMDAMFCSKEISRGGRLSMKKHKPCMDTDNAYFLRSYITYVAPTALRGMFGSLNQLFVTIGALAALAVNLVFAAEQWR
eukprot:scaffold12447_cov37-Prasinocladus_malaysianus.AAC.1